MNSMMKANKRLSSFIISRNKARAVDGGDGEAVDFWTFPFFFAPPSSALFKTEKLLVTVVVSVLISNEMEQKTKKT